MKKVSLLLSLAIILNLGVMAQRSRVNIPAKDRKTLIEEASATSQTTQPTSTSKLLLSGYYMESFEGTFPPTGWSKLMPYTTTATGWRQCANGTAPLYLMFGGTQTVPPMGGDKVAFCDYATGYYKLGTDEIVGYDQYLVTPQFTVAASDSLKFNLFRYGFFMDSLEVLVSTSGNDIASFNTNLLSIQSFNINNNDWAQYSVDLTPFAGQNIYIAFREHVLDDDTNETVGSYFALDRVSIGNVGSLIDVASSSIDINSRNLQTAQTPTATFFNEGSGSQTFDVTMTINPGNYTSTKTVTNIASGTPQQVSFDSWDATQLGGNYTAKIFTNFASDQNHNNDTITKQIEVVSFQNKAFVFVAYDWSSPMIPLRTAIYDLADSSKVWVLKEDFDVDNYPLIMGGAWANNHWYATNNNGEFAEIDTTTGDITIIGSLGCTINEIAYDNTTSTMYGVSQGFSPGQSNLYTINTATGEATLIGGLGLIGFNTLACKQGILYATNVTTDSFYSVDKSTGLATKIGDLGFNSNNYSQGLDFDPNGNLYMSCVNEPDTITTNGELRYVDLTTGNASLINQFMGGYGYANNITGFVIPGSSWQDGLGVKNAINKGSHLEIYPNPAQENVYFVSSDQILNYKIITISGQVIVNEKATNSAIAVNISEFKSGFYFVQIETEKGITTKKLNITR